MPPPSRNPMPSRGAWIGLAIALGAAGIGSGPSPAPASTVGDRGHICSCGMACKSACCCKHDRPATPDPAPTRTRPASPSPSTGPSGPCLDPAPCGGALPPMTPSSAGVGERADRPAVERPRRPGPGEVLAPPSSDRAEARVGSRPDEPPEAVDVA